MKTGLSHILSVSGLRGVSYDAAYIFVNLKTG